MYFYQFCCFFLPFFSTFYFSLLSSPPLSSPPLCLLSSPLLSSTLSSPARGASRPISERGLGVQGVSFYPGPWSQRPGRQSQKHILSWLKHSLPGLPLGAGERQKSCSSALFELLFKWSPFSQCQYLYLPNVIEGKNNYLSLSVLSVRPPSTQTVTKEVNIYKHRSGARKPKKHEEREKAKASQNRQLFGQKDCQPRRDYNPRIIFGKKCSFKRRWFNERGGSTGTRRLQLY